MAINTTWKIEIGVYAGFVDFSTRTLGVSINQQVDVNVIGRGTCTITLLNKDGALTPGGGGTYGTRDWFSNMVRVTALTNTGGANTSTTVFEGIVTDFALEDDGVYSAVTITALDGLSIAGRTTNVISNVGSDYAYNTFPGAQYQQQLPRVGANNTVFYFDYEGTAGYPQDYTYTPTAVNASTYADAWQTYQIPTVNDVAWGTYITFTAGPQAEYRAISLGCFTTRAVAQRHDFEFDPPASLSGSKLPFDQQGFEQGFNNDTLITQAVFNVLSGSSTTVTATAATLTTYGARTVSYTQTLPVDTASAQTLANRLVNRYSVQRFTPVQLRTTGKMVNRYAADAAVAKWRALLGVEHGIWQKAKITWTGSGAASQTAYSVIKGRRIEITPSDCFVTLTLGNWTDNHGFILDTDTLDTDRLG